MSRRISSGASEYPSRASRRAHQGVIRRVRALSIAAFVLAFGAVAALGSALTMASWTDDEFATASVSASTFGLESQLGSSGSFSPTSEENPGVLSFDQSVSGLRPGDQRYTRVQIRTQESSINGSVQFMGLSNQAGDLAQYLRYSAKVQDSSSETCDASSFSSSAYQQRPAAFLAYGAKIQGSADPAPSDAVQQLAAESGSTAQYCLQLLMPEDVPNAAQGQTADLWWRFNGVSGEES